MPVAFVEPPPTNHHGVSFDVEEDGSPTKLSEEKRLERMMNAHQTLVDMVHERNEKGIIPFAKDCQARLEALGGWQSHGIHMTDSPPPVVQDTFLLPHSKSQFPVTVLDGVLSQEVCRSFIDVHEKVGFAKPPSLLVSLVEQLEGQQDAEYLKKYAYEQAKNTSELVQIESNEFAAYLWAHIQDHLPDQQASFGQFTTGMYQKCGIIPVFRFMRYEQDQGFKPHTDPQRIFTKCPPLHHNSTTATTTEGEPGIYQSLFTIALYLNDPATDFEGGKLNFVKLHVDSDGTKRYQSLATVDPAVGRCVLFSHEELHEGGGVQAGTKYMCQCDVLYKRVGDLP
ncbi:P4Hc [Seminavis robusta]|uniref:P4Hc n=1 Tax=Seminavis robusta TaxID=568900 RepID=A0A9N8D8D9_9STRA|nr:P4Hc [Seminavis robusta]|eukprot:Sro14_g010690.1 P4Hc (339) ;mRNA; r:116838-117854